MKTRTCAVVLGLILFITGCKEEKKSSAPVVASKPEIIHIGDLEVHPYEGQRLRQKPQIIATLKFYQENGRRVCRDYGIGPFSPNDFILVGYSPVRMLRNSVNPYQNNKDIFDIFYADTTFYYTDHVVTSQEMSSFILPCYNPKIDPIMKDKKRFAIWVILVSAALLPIKRTQKWIVLFMRHIPWSASGFLKIVKSMVGIAYSILLAGILAAGTVLIIRSVPVMESLVQHTKVYCETHHYPWEIWGTLIAAFAFTSLMYTQFPPALFSNKLFDVLLPAIITCVLAFAAVSGAFSVMLQRIDSITILIFACFFTVFAIPIKLKLWIKSV